MSSTPTSRRLQVGLVAPALMMSALIWPGALAAQSEMPTASEVREALETLRRFERALAAESGRDAGGPVRSELAQSEQAKPRALPGEISGRFQAQALTSATLGSGPSPQVVTPPASLALNIDGDFDLGGFVFKNGLPFIHNDGGATYGNTAVGLNALVSSMPGTPNFYHGTDNSAFGYGALRNNTTGFRNTASGAIALHSNTTGVANTASGYQALRNNTTGSFNTASGDRALYYNTTGSFNTAIGQSAGFFWTTGDSNIAIGYGAFGAAGESGVIRIGGNNDQTQTFVEGISNASGVFDDAEVCIEGDQLGPCSSSSVRFKQDVQSLGDVLSGLSALRPVSFRYREELDPMSIVRYGLIAEEVAAVFPSLVGYDEEGRPHTVRYDLLTPLLLGEIQRQDGVLVHLQRQMADRDRAMVDMERRLNRLAKKKRFR